MQIERLPLSEQDYDTLYEKWSKSRNQAYIVGAVIAGAYFLLMIVPMGFIPTRRPQRLENPDETLFAALGGSVYNIVFLCIALLLFSVWYFAEYKKLDEDYNEGEKIRFKAQLRNLKNIPDDKTLFLAELGPNEMGISSVRMPLTFNIRLKDELILEVTPRMKVILRVEKVENNTPSV